MAASLRDCCEDFASLLVTESVEKAAKKESVPTGFWWGDDDAVEALFATGAVGGGAVGPTNRFRFGSGVSHVRRVSRQM